MAYQSDRRTFLGILGGILAWPWLSALGQTTTAPSARPNHPKRAADEYVLPKELAEFARLSLVLGRPTDRSLIVSVLATEALEGYLEYGTVPGRYDQKTKLITLVAGEPVEVQLSDLCGAVPRRGFKMSGTLLNSWPHAA